MYLLRIRILNSGRGRKENKTLLSCELDKKGTAMEKSLEHMVGECGQGRSGDTH